MGIKKTLALAGFCLALDIVAFIVLAFLIAVSTNIWCTVLFGIMVYIIAWDAFHASVYLMNHFKNKLQ